jgi:hypothetical protein
MDSEGDVRKGETEREIHATSFPGSSLGKSLGTRLKSMLVKRNVIDVNNNSLSQQYRISYQSVLLKSELNYKSLESMIFKLFFQ